MVYRGYYKKTGETNEMRVAIKVSIPKIHCQYAGLIGIHNTFIDLIYNRTQHSIGIVSDSPTEKRHEQRGS